MNRLATRDKHKAPALLLIHPLSLQDGGRFHSVSLLWRNFLERGFQLNALLSAHDAHNDVIYHSHDRNGKSLDKRFDADLAEGGGGEGDVEYEGPAYQHYHAHNGQDRNTREA